MLEALEPFLRIELSKYYTYGFFEYHPNFLTIDQKIKFIDDIQPYFPDILFTTSYRPTEDYFPEVVNCGDISLIDIDAISDNLFSFEHCIWVNDPMKYYRKNMGKYLIRDPELSIYNKIVSINGFNDKKTKDSMIPINIKVGYNQKISENGVIIYLKPGWVEELESYNWIDVFDGDGEKFIYLKLKCGHTKREAYNYIVDISEYASMRMSKNGNIIDRDECNTPLFRDINKIQRKFVDHYQSKLKKFFKDINQRDIPSALMDQIIEYYIRMELFT